MGLFTRDIESLDDLFAQQLGSIYYAEQQILEALQTMIGAASSRQLKDAFDSHWRQTENQLERLDRVFELHGREPETADCPAIDGLIEEATDLANEIADKDVLDAALIASAQAIEHYEISRYGALIAWAKRLGRQDCASLLQQTLKEEKSTDQKLTELAEQAINRRAA
jgi:ferritin-like metal-binding protein YciE